MNSWETQYWQLPAFQVERGDFSPAPRPEAAHPLQIPSPRLFRLQRHEQRLEIPRPEAVGAVTLDDLKENSRPILDTFREDLEQVTVLVAVGQYAETLQCVQRLVNLPAPLR